MHFEPPDAYFFEAVHFGGGVLYIFRMHGPKRQQSLGIGGTIFGDPIVYFGGETDYVRADVIDQAGALDFRGVHKFQEFGRARRVFFHFIVIAAATFDEFERGGIDHSVRVDVDVNVNDRRQFRALLNLAMIPVLYDSLQVDSLQAVDFLLVEAQGDAPAGHDHGSANQIWFAYHHANGFGAGGGFFFLFFLGLQPFPCFKNLGWAATPVYFSRPAGAG